MHQHTGRALRVIAYVSGGAAFAALTHRWNTEAATSLATAVGVLAAIFGFLPRMVAAQQREAMETLIDKRFVQLREDLGSDVSTALRHAVELGVHEGNLRRSLGRTAGEPPRPTHRLHAVPRHRESS